MLPMVLTSFARLVNPWSSSSYRASTPHLRSASTISRSSDHLGDGQVQHRAGLRGQVLSLCRVAVPGAPPLRLLVPAPHHAEFVQRAERSQALVVQLARHDQLLRSTSCRGRCLPTPPSVSSTKPCLVGVPCVIFRLVVDGEGTAGSGGVLVGADHGGIHAYRSAHALRLVAPSPGSEPRSFGYGVCRPSASGRTRSAGPVKGCWSGPARTLR